VISRFLFELFYCFIGLAKVNQQNDKIGGKIEKLGQELKLK